jgi:glycosyltransferase involved in cell wall biosynthesis
MYKVTVGICCYNQKKWLYRCLRSLANQTLQKKDFEVVVVNDDPRESLEDVCEKLGDVLNIKLINNRKNIGLPGSLNKILNNSRGRYFTRVDCDDYVSRNYLEYLTVFLENNRNFQAVSCDYKTVNEVGTVINHHISQNDECIACATMFTYESLCEIGFYNEEFKMREGHDLFNRYVEKFKIFNIPLPFYRYRMHDKNRTKDLKNVEIYDKMLHNN